jgi:glycosyltransferase involved in cell wall biosynthesis
MTEAKEDWNPRWNAAPSPADRVSVVIACFNCKPYIDEAIDSAFCQTLKAHEVIAVDDGSTDGTWEYLHLIKTKRHPTLRILCHPERSNQGASATRQRGVREASGDYVAFLDGDDIHLPEKLEYQVNALKANPEVVLCHSAIMVIGDRSRAEGFEGYFRHNPKSPYHLRNRNDYLVNNFINTSSVMVRTSLIQKINFAIPCRPHQVEDWLCWCLISAHGKFLYLDLALSGYRVHPASTTTAIDGNRLIKLHALLECRLALLARSPFSLHWFRVALAVMSCLQKMQLEYKAILSQ